MRFLSLFSGIEAASVAWTPLGWACVGVAEIEPFPCAVLAHHYHEVPNLGSVTDITDEQIAALGPIDVVIGGSPCQDLSVAGKRAGLAGERSGLFHHQLRIFHAARHLCGARFLVWENVPGAFSSHGGRDFAVVVGEMAGCRLPVPADGWGTEGVAVGEHGLVEWAVLDAQWFGVAQRRRRVFAVLDVGDWADRPPILLEPDRLRGDSAPSREARKDAAGSTGDGLARCLTTGEAKRQDWETCNLIAHSLRAQAQSSHRVDTETFVAHSLRGEGFDGSEDGTGRGTPLVPVTVGSLTCGSGGSAGHTYRQKGNEDSLIPVVAPTLDQRAGRSGETSFATSGGLIPVACDVWNQTIDGDVAATLNAESGAPNHSGPKVMVPVAFSCKDHGADASDIAPTLRSMGHDGSHANGGGQVAVAFMADDYKDGGYEECDTARPLTTSADRTRAAPVVTTLAIRGRGDSHDLEMRTDGTANALLTPNGGRAGIGVGAIHCGMQVRRLTPVECCRLQGFPDDYLSQVPWRGKIPPPDGPMYKALGNSMAVPVMRWIGEAIMKAAA